MIYIFRLYYIYISLFSNEITLSNGKLIYLFCSIFYYIQFLLSLFYLKYKICIKSYKLCICLENRCILHFVLFIVRLNIVFKYVYWFCYGLKILTQFWIYFSLFSLKIDNYNELEILSWGVFPCDTRVDYILYLPLYNLLFLFFWSSLPI